MEIELQIQNNKLGLEQGRNMQICLSVMQKEKSQSICRLKLV
jgi:hypothetical protein